MSISHTHDVSQLEVLKMVRYQIRLDELRQVVQWLTQHLDRIASHLANALVVPDISVDSY